MKRSIAILLALALALSLAACGGGKPDSGSSGASGGSDASGDGEKTYRVGFILDSSVNDGGWGTACYSELTAAVERNPKWSMESTDNLSHDSFYDAMVAYCNAGFDLIYAPGGE